MSNEVKPKIDDQFWFDYSLKVTDSAIERRDKAAERIQTLVTWLWGIYTASAAVGFALSGKGLSLGYALMIASASAGLILVYWATVWVLTPRLGSFDPRSPDDIQDDFNELVKTKTRRLNITLGAALFAAALVAASLIVASVAEEASPVAPSFSPSVHVLESETVLALTGKIPEAKQVTIHVQADGDTPTTSRKLVLLEEGVLESSIPLSWTADEYEVTVEWTTTPGVTFRATKRVAASEGDES